MVEFGIVVSFNDSEDKRYGFVQPCDEAGNLKDEEDLFFHYNGYGIIGTQSDGVTPKLLSGRRHAPPPSFPMEGDQLVFKRVKTRQGHKAHRWVYVAAYKDALERYQVDDEVHDPSLSFGDINSLYKAGLKQCRSTPTAWDLD